MVVIIINVIIITIIIIILQHCHHMMVVELKSTFGLDALVMKKIISFQLYWHHYLCKTGFINTFCIARFIILFDGDTFGRNSCTDSDEMVEKIVNKSIKAALFDTF